MDQETDFRKLQEEVVAAKPKAGARVVLPPVERYKGTHHTTQTLMS